IYRFFKRTDNVGIGVLFFTLADFLSSSRGSNNISYKSGISEKDFFIYQDFINCKNSLRKIFAWYIQDKEKIQVKRFLSGNDIMELFKLEPSKKVGEILDLLNELQALGKIKNKKQAIDSVKKFLLTN
ncbi:MAG: hypothetical protein LBF97_06985, partial [Elusimicrobiota bacterium]|nr:hypothetical protein [Elusimicrobiota bacterium]